MAAQAHAGHLKFARRQQEDRLDVECDALVARYQQGDTGAFRLLYEKVFDQLLLYSRTLLRDVHEAEEVAQEALIAGLLKLRSFEIGNGPPFRVLLLRIARNQALNRRRRLRRVDITDAVSLERLIDVREEAPSPLEHLLRLERWGDDKHLAIFIRRLPAEQQNLIELRYGRGMAFDEIATELGKSPAATRQLHTRALATLRGLMAGVGRRTRADRVPTLTRVKYLPVMARRRFALQGSFRPQALAAGRFAHRR